MLTQCGTYLVDVGNFAVSWVVLSFGPLRIVVDNCEKCIGVEMIGSHFFPIQLCLSLIGYDIPGRLMSLFLCPRK